VPSGRTALILGVCLVVAAGAAATLLATLRPPGRAARAAPAPAAAIVSPVTHRAAPRPGPSAPPERVATPAPRPDPFPASAAAYLAGRAGVASAAVYDVTTRQLWTIGPARPQAEASVVKVDIALAQSMIEDSDNAAATDLWDAAGGTGGIRSFNAAAGLEDTTPSPCVQCAGFGWPGWGLSTTTPSDQIALLRQIAQPGGLLTGTQRRYAAALMENVASSQRWGVSGGVAPQATVALKNGWLPLNQAGTDWQINSVGWISGLGRDYLMAVLTTGNPDEQYGIDTIGWLSAAVWQQLG
jgi:hypothetical protein